MIENIPYIMSAKQRLTADRQAEREEAKKIVNEIMNAGVSNNQVMFIIRQLALNLEDASLGSMIFKAVKMNMEEKEIILPK